MTSWLCLRGRIQRSEAAGQKQHAEKHLGEYSPNKTKWNKQKATKKTVPAGGKRPQKKEMLRVAGKTRLQEDGAEPWEEPWRARKPLRGYWTSFLGQNLRDEGLPGAPWRQGLPVLADSPPRAHTQWRLVNVSWNTLISWRVDKATRKSRRGGASLVVQWLRIRLPMQGTRVRALVQEDPTCRGATKPVRHNYWACALEPVSHNYWACMPQLLKPTHLQPVLHSKE